MAKQGSDIISEFNGLLYDLGNAKLKLKQLNDSIPDTNKKDNEDIKKAEEEISNIRLELQGLRSGVKADDFLSKAIFSMNRRLTSGFYQPTVEMYTFSKGKVYDKLSDEDKKKFDDEFIKYKDENKGIEDAAYEVFKQTLELSQEGLRKAKDKGGSINYLKDLNTKLDEFMETDPISEVEQKPSKEKFDAFIKEEIEANNGIDNLIENLSLNPQKLVLDDDEKLKLVNDHYEKEQLDIMAEDRGESYTKYFNLGTDVRYYGEKERLEKLLGLITDIKNEYGYIDTNTALKINMLLEKFNKFDFDDAILSMFRSNNITLNEEIVKEALRTQGTSADKANELFKKLSDKDSNLKTLEVSAGQGLEVIPKLSVVDYVDENGSKVENAKSLVIEYNKYLGQDNLFTSNEDGTYSYNGFKLDTSDENNYKLYVNGIDSEVKHELLKNSVKTLETFGNPILDKDGKQIGYNYKINNEIQKVYEEDEEGNYNETDKNDVYRTDSPNTGSFLILNTSVPIKTVAPITTDIAPSLVNLFKEIYKKYNFKSLTELHENTNLPKEFTKYKEETKEVVPLITNSNNLLESTDKSIISEMVSTISKLLYDRDLSDTYKEQLQDLSKGSTINEYAIDDPNITNDLNRLTEVLEIIDSIITFSLDSNNPNLPFNYLEIINKNRLEDKLESLSVEQVSSISKELSNVYESIQTLKIISDANNETKTKENILTRGILDNNLLTLLLDDEDLKTVTVNGDKFFDYSDKTDDIPDISDIREKVVSKQELTVEEFSKLEGLLIKAEDYYYDKFQKLVNDNNTTAIDELFTQVTKSFTKMIPMIINKDMTISDINNESKAQYLVMIFTTKASDIKSRINKTLTKDKYKDIISISTQEYVIRQGLTGVIGNEYIKMIYDKAAKIDDLKDGFFDNITFISGSAGAGKTRVIANITNDILQDLYPGSDLITYGVRQRVSDNISQTIENSTSLFGDNLLLKFFNEDDAKEIANLRSNGNELP